MILDCLIPTHNNEKHLDECFLSLEKQTMQDFRVLVYDDASSDQTPNIVKHWENRLHIECFSESQPQGWVHSLNNLLKRSRSKYVCWQLPTDLSHPKRFEKQLIKLKKSSLVGLGTGVVWDLSMHHEESNTVQALVNPKDVLFAQIGSKDMRGSLFETMMYERKALSQVPDFDPMTPFFFDIEFHANLQMKFPLRIANISEPLYTARTFQGSLHDREYHNKNEVDFKAIAFKVRPALNLVKHLYIDNTLVSRGYLPY